MKRTDLIPGTEYAVRWNSYGSVIRAAYVGVGEPETVKSHSYYRATKNIRQLVFELRQEAPGYIARLEGVGVGDTFTIETSRFIEDTWAEHQARIDHQRAYAEDQERIREANQAQVDRFNAALGDFTERAVNGPFELQRGHRVFGAKADHISIPCEVLDALRIALAGN